MTLRVKNWRSFQHYKDRNPLWIKLHKSLLDDYKFQCLPVASKALAPMLWLLASESKTGEIDATPDEICFRLRMVASDFYEALNPLVSMGFFEQDGIASELIAEPEQVDIPEKRREETEKNIEPPVISILLNDGTEHNVFAGDVTLWKQLYPSVDVMQQLRNMVGWSISNPAKRKTHRGIQKFINSWLSRAQDSGNGHAKPMSDQYSLKGGLEQVLSRRRANGFHD